MRTYLLLDTNYLAYRALHTTGALEHGDVKTGVVYGILRDVITLQRLFNTDRLVFCFDHGEGLRKSMNPVYKISRQIDTTDPAEVIARREFRVQVEALKTVFLKQVGFKNVFYANGFEADDVIASICNWLPDEHEAVIVSADKDLYQLLRKNVYLYNPTTKATHTHETFVKTWGIKPKRWPKVKAMAGCKTDDVIGIKGIGEKTAAKYLLGQIKEGSLAQQVIEENTDLIAHNLKLVKLPLEGTPEFIPVKDKVEPERWVQLTKALGMKSLMSAVGISHVPKGVRNGTRQDKGRQLRKRDVPGFF